MIALVFAALVSFIPGSTAMWSDGNYTWAGPKECAYAWLLKPDSPAVNHAEWIAGLHCPLPGPDPSGCAEWAETAPDIGACEYVPVREPNNVGDLSVQ